MIFLLFIPRLNSKFDYSTEEVAIGKWFDGKTLYRKAIKVTLTNYDDLNKRRVFTYNPNVGSIKKCYGTYFETRNAGTFEYLFGTTLYGGDLLVMDASSSYANGLRFDSAVTQGATKIETNLIIEYTKD